WLDLGQYGKIGVAIKELLLIVFLHFDELNNLVGKRVGEDAHRMPGSQPKLWIIPIARKSRITPESIFDRLLLMSRVHSRQKNLNEHIELTYPQLLPRNLAID